MRAFLAIPMPEHVADDLAALTAHLRTGRAVASDDMHLTLAFLGDVTLAQLDALHMSLEMLHVAPFSLRLAGKNQYGNFQTCLDLLRNITRRNGPQSSYRYVCRQVCWINAKSR